MRARAAYGDAVKVYVADFTPMYHAMTTRKTHTDMKLVCVGPEQRIVGCHVIGAGADEMMQGFAVAVRNGRDQARLRRHRRHLTRRVRKNSSPCADAAMASARLPGIQPGTGWPALYIDEFALVIGRVTLGDDASVWPFAVVRGDVNRIEIGARTNIQDGSVLHVVHEGPSLPGRPAARHRRRCHGRAQGDAARSAHSAIAV